jgi:uncharacterized membrane protein YhaH (DUF805 family)
MDIVGRLFSFEGRVNRLTYISLWLPLSVLNFVVSLMIGSGGAVGDFLLLCILGVGVWIQLATIAKRLHDTNRSGWNMLVGLIPLIGGLALLYWTLILPGTPARIINVYGDPQPGWSP